jgi:PadR family transcriptional regulator PadR
VTADPVGPLRGTLDLLVLQALVGEPRHGYAVAKWVRSASDDTIEIEDGALYTSLHRMEDRGWIAAEWGMSESNRRAKYYTLTGSGRRQLDTATKEWARYSAAVNKVILRGGRLGG